MDERDASAAGAPPQDKAEDRRALRELKEKSEHLDEVIGEARDAVRDAQRAGTVGTEQPGGQAETGAVGGDAEEAHGGGGDGDDEGRDDEIAAADDRSDTDTGTHADADADTDADAREPQKAE
ncbi:MAG TPA: hypothetical protein VGM10_27565 [Actinocrinis sp.]|jgi:hypothetical protein